MSKLYLHGGGNHSDFLEKTFGRFVEDISLDDSPIQLGLFIVEPESAPLQDSINAYSEIFMSAGLEQVNLVPLGLTPDRPIDPASIASFTALFICGGLTPLYHKALCTNREWLRSALEHRIPIGGTSAGAAILARNAILGGWLSERNALRRDFLFKGASEGIDPLTIKPGLGLFPMSIDVHASQMGTLSRLIQAVDLGLIQSGIAIDEDTLLIDHHGRIEVAGRGHAYQVWKNDAGRVECSIFVEGDWIERVR